MNTTNKINFISIEGSIGAGKSTLLQHVYLELQRRGLGEDRVYTVPESIDEWNGVTDEGKTILQLFYQDKKKYAFAFQCLTLTTLFKNIRRVSEKHPDTIILSERSLYSNRFIFENMLYDSGDMSHIEHVIYEKMWNEYNRMMFQSITIYVNTDVKTCVNRIIQRQRPGEGEIPLKYLNELHVRHQNLIYALRQVENHKLVLFDGNLTVNTLGYNTRVNELVDLVTVL